ncbi:SNARE domain containing protein [Entamoeba histolytica HM-1:IMSS-B]|uniref:t-SNARE coiled-coil homology domain-containing protein n=7 Tax=Entamoeba histolytica TaxID=5759 RepID=A0A8U0WP74_ENTH1|nr:hypothetical protein EHI_082090 [Entamoeba histolytica HM-1:IMSS]EMD49018.1 SNARE domain containing protein [Entamoeba histolytica KU27]EMH72698.1 SNARE domain containing protein [Entamoeba histolytica HM-1:IMSS-B]EMS15853.1 SNARE domain containing protein [Entamoeba histolytica HM-3:IMSS]ENY65395.1 SNARE domain containing protein [Entamoeba histolytica HM-1:IMSS-A]BAE94805.1 EhSyntaxin A [Entamoeba histolytica]|eukprot:XP_651917.1 hypothetical protein EHI_082090 [Entamoeba histolytica HM-1:IMSS]
MTDTAITSLKNNQRTITTTIKKLKLATKNNDEKLYNLQYKMLEDQINQFNKTIQTLKQFKNETDELEKNIEGFEEWIYSIHSSIPPAPVVTGNESSPLINKDEVYLQQESESVLAIHQENTEQIKTIVDKQKELHQTFLQLNGMVQIQQTQIDSIEHNVLTTDKKVNEGNKEIDTAEKYQRKSSKKLKIILLVSVIIVLALILIIGIVLYFKLN